MNHHDLILTFGLIWLAAVVAKIARRPSDRADRMIKLAGKIAFAIYIVVAMGSLAWLGVRDWLR